MKAKKIVRYRMPVSVKFPAKHKRAGEATNFVQKIESSTICRKKCFGECEMCEKFRWLFSHKIHTIRTNYSLWAKRFEKINRGEAVLELYYWSGKPYNSKAVTICQLGKDDGIGLQQLDFAIWANEEDINSPYITKENNPMVGCFIDANNLAKNDGLSFYDFKEWFKGYDLSEPMAIIHFTSFRY